MKREEDIFQIYNEMENMLESVNLNNNNKIDNKQFPKMQEIVFEEDDILFDKPKENLIDLNEEKIEENLLNELEINNLEEIEEEKIELDIPVDTNFNKESNIIEEFDNKIEQKEDKKNKKRKSKKVSKKWIITFSILDSIAIVCLFLMYGPISYFRNLWVTSAMTTATHRYLAYTFFTPEQVQGIMSSNIVIESGESTNTNDIEFTEPPLEEVEYSSIYEEQVLKRDEGNDLYKVIDIEGDGYKGHLLVVYDPSKIQLVQVTNLKYGLTIEEFTNKYNAVAGINAGGFNYNASVGYTTTGTVIIDGEILGTGTSTRWGGGIIGFNEDNVLVLTKASEEEAVQMGIRDAVSFGPFLIVNGVPSEFKGNGGYGIAPRTAIGQRKDGIVLLLVIDGRRIGHSLGVDMVELTNILLNYGAYNASNLDGGGSSTMVVNGETLSVAGGAGYSGDRYLPNAWLVTN